VQKTFLAPSIANAGRTSRVETLYLDGSTDLAAEALLMRIWQNGGNLNNPADAVQVRIVGSEAHGRVGGGPWQQIDDFTASFAPGNDPAGLMAAAQNVRPLERSKVESFSAQRYAFDLSGPLLADYMRAQLEDRLRRDTGFLP